MSYELTFESRTQYLYAVVSASKMDVQIGRAYMAEVAAKCAELGHRRVLLVRDVPAMMRSGSIFAVINYFVEVMRGKRIAFVNPYNEIEKDMDFAILIGNNRGAVYEVFDNETDAEIWLLSDGLTDK